MTRVLALKSQSPAPSGSPGHRDSLRSVSFVSLARELLLILIPEVKYTGAGMHMSTYPTLAASDNADLSALEYERLLRLLVAHSS